MEDLASRVFGHKKIQLKISHVFIRFREIYLENINYYAQTLLGYL